MTKVRMWNWKRDDETVEVSYPLFRQMIMSADWWTEKVYECVGPSTTVRLSCLRYCAENRIEYKIETKSTAWEVSANDRCRSSMWSDREYLLGKGEHALEPHEWAEVYVEALKSIAEAVK